MLVSACSSPTDVNDQLDVTLRVDRAVVTPTSPAEITVVIRNRGPRTVLVASPDSYACFRPYIVHDLNNQPITLPGRFCLAISNAQLALATGDSAVVRDSWSGDAGDSNGDTRKVAAGQYNIRAQVMSEGRFATSAPATVVVVRTADSR
jgi:hypothetical protein